MTLLVFLLMGFVSPNQGAPVIMGKQQTRFLIHSANNNFSFPQYHNNGYSQTIDRENTPGEVLVRVSNTQLASQVRSRQVAGLPPAMSDLQNQLNQKDSGRLADQVFLIIQWIRTNINAETELLEDQGPEAVLERRSGNCVGLSNLAIFVLQQMGVKARYVTGVAFKRDDPVVLRLEGNVLHRWIEVYYEDVGWVFCDPAGKVNYVEATYLVLGVQNLHPIPNLLAQALSTRVELLHFSDGFRTVGAVSGADGRIRTRPNRLALTP